MSAFKIFGCILLSAALCLSSCTRIWTKGQIRKTLSRFEAEEIRVPESLIEINNGSVKRKSQKQDSLPLFVIYFPSYECSDCVLSHIEEYKPVFDLAEETGTFIPMILFSPEPDSVKELIEKIACAHFSFPVYVDIDYLMQNNRIPHDRLYHSFLIGSQDKPVFVGNPMASEKTKSLFLSIIQNEQKISFNNQ